MLQCVFLEIVGSISMHFCPLSFSLLLLILGGAVQKKEKSFQF